MDAKLNASGSDNGIRSIVVVEDSRDVADSIRYSLEHQGFRVRVATTRQAALDLVLDHPPNLVLLDIDLPEMCGLELCRVFRAEAATMHVPIVMLTTRSGKSDKVLGLELGADDYLTKPFSSRELLARVNAILRRSDGPDEGPAYDDQSVWRINSIETSR